MTKKIDFLGDSTLFMAWLFPYTTDFFALMIPVSTRIQWHTLLVVNCSQKVKQYLPC